jgi:uncharacterized protein (DUF427 family)
MPRALWNNQIIAETENFESVDGNVYFPTGTVKADKLEPSDHTSFCPWKGMASYYDVVVDGERNKNAAWYYPEPKEKALNIKDHIAFWKGVTVEN